MASHHWSYVKVLDQAVTINKYTNKKIEPLNSVRLFAFKQIGQDNNYSDTESMVKAEEYAVPYSTFLSCESH